STWGPGSGDGPRAGAALRSGARALSSGGRPLRGASAPGGHRRQPHELGAAADAHLAEEPAELVARREVRRPERRGDLPIVVATADVIEDFLLAGREPCPEGLLHLARPAVAEPDDR